MSACHTSPGDRAANGAADGATDGAAADRAARTTRTHPLDPVTAAEINDRGGRRPRRRAARRAYPLLGRDARRGVRPQGCRRRGRPASVWAWSRGLLRVGGLGDRRR